MTFEELEQRLKLGEDTVTEFKSTVVNNYQVDSKDIAKAITAMANTKGGLLFLGVEDDGMVSGAGTPQQVDKLMLQVSNICQSIQPPLTCSFQKLEFQGQTLLVVEVPRFSAERPYHAAGKYYVRDANQSREARRDELRRLLESADYHFDEEPVAGSRFEDLDPEAIRVFLAILYDEPDEASGRQLLSALQCLDATGTPTVTGMLLFGREPQRRFLDARISAVLVKGTELTSDFVDRKEITGRLFDQVDDAVTFLKKNVRSPSHVEGLERIEEGLPEKVLREAVLNAVAHRDYRAASQVRIYVFDDRVEIVNPGELLNQLTLEGIRIGGISQRRNPVLAGLLARARRRENLGMGVPEMIRQMKARKLPPPEFSVGNGHFRVVLRLAGEGGHA
ncbi:RNA-binding domain-containing protein [Cystobacter fuscus]|uniref:RNA-binding domain-containing protein n=1 Tax=Cystobacter fuscus TaxID=43 RepID=UPI0037C127F1